MKPPISHRVNVGGSDSRLDEVAALLVEAMRRKGLRAMAATSSAPVSLPSHSAGLEPELGRVSNEHSPGTVRP